MNTKPYDMDEAIAVLAGALHPKTCLKWFKLSRARQEQIVRGAFERGIITHKRGDDEKLH
jgi:hypothetical protein